MSFTTNKLGNKKINLFARKFSILTFLYLHYQSNVFVSFVIIHNIPRKSHYQMRDRILYLRKKRHSDSFTKRQVIKCIM